MPLFLLFVVLPIAEIFVLIQVGSAIGAWPTIGLVVLSALVGSWLMRRQGAAALADLQRSFAELRDPTRPIAHGAMILFAGALMVAPGFITDLFGLALLLPPVRDALMRWAGRRMVVVSSGFGPQPGGPRGPQPPRDRVIDAEFEVVEEAPPSAPHSARDEGPHDEGPRPPSGWTRG